MQIYRINMMFLSRAAMDKVGATKTPATWAEFNALADEDEGGRHHTRSPTAASAGTTA